MKKGKSYEFYVETNEFPDTGVATCEGIKVYIKNTLPGQKVLARVTKKRREYAQAKKIKVLEDVDYKIEKKCPIFGQCGGCAHQDVPYDKQLKFKEDQVFKLFKEADIKDFLYLGIEGSPEKFEYRNKMEFTFGDMEKGGELNLGMHAKGRSFGVINADCCQIVDQDFRIVLKIVLDYFKERNFSHYRVLSREGFLRNLVIRKATNTSEIIINIVTTSQMEFDFTEIVEILKNLQYKGKLMGILHTTNDSLADMVKGDKIDVLYGRDYIMEDLLGLKFKITPFSFFQTNSKGAEKLYTIVKEFLGDLSSKTVFDLYCGTGTIGQIVAPNAKKVLGIEIIEEAVNSANENAKLNGLTNCKFIAGDVGKVITEIKDKPDVIILDPPRPGVHPVALDYVIKFDAKDIIYVSCNPKTLVKDLKVLESSGYIIEKMKIKDMFPHTPHIECVVKLKRKHS